MSIHDVGAGGLSNALPELVHDADRGAHFQLRDILNDEPGMSPHELWCNESQERYVLAIEPQRLAEFEALCARERCPYAVVGEATEAKHLRVDDSHFGDAPIDLPMGLLLGKTPRMHREGQRLSVDTVPFQTAELDLEEAATRVLRIPTVASKGF